MLVASRSICGVTLHFLLYVFADASLKLNSLRRKLHRGWLGNCGGRGVDAARQRKDELRRRNSTAKTKTAAEQTPLGGDALAFGQPVLPQGCRLVAPALMLQPSNACRIPALDLLLRQQSWLAVKKTPLPTYSSEGERFFGKDKLCLKEKNARISTYYSHACRRIKYQISSK